jgi:energy-coupling factor transporter transmembrane protein EcfT
MNFHPAAQILTWCVMVVSMQAMALGPLLMTAGLILLVAFSISRHKFIQLLRRTRWIMLSLLLIYAYSTPGQSLSDSLGMFGPSREGLLDGVLQLARLLAALAGLAILLDHMRRQQLIAGLYTLFAPLKWIGLSRERFAVRLALTLHYAEVAMLHDTHVWQDSLGSLMDQQGKTDSNIVIELPVSRFMVSDMLLLCSALILLAATIQ